MKVLIVRLSAFGDIVHALPVAENAARSGATVGWLVERTYVELLASNPSVSSLFLADTRAWKRAPFTAPRAIGALGQALRSFAPDLVLDVQGLWKSALLARLARAPVFGFSGAFRRERASAFLANRRVRPEGARHVVDANLALVSAAGIPVERKAPDARYLLAAEAPEAAAFLSGLPRPFALYHPGAGWPEKTWGEERFAELARRLLEGRGLHPVVSWGPGDEQRAARLARQVPEAIALPRLGLPGLAHVTAAAALFVGGDTGPLHLADALGIPVVAVFGPTDPERNGPYGHLRSVVRGGAQAPVSEVAAAALAALAPA